MVSEGMSLLIAIICHAVILIPTCIFWVQYIDDQTESDEWKEHMDDPDYWGDPY